MLKIINKKEIKQLFNELVKKYQIKTSKKKNFENFIKFLEIDFYDWLRDNLKNYFKN